MNTTNVIANNSEVKNTKNNSTVKPTIEVKESIAISTPKKKRTRKPKTTIIVDTTIKDVVIVSSINFEGDEITRNENKPTVKVGEVLKEGKTTKTLSETTKKISKRIRDERKTFSYNLRSFINDEKEHKELKDEFKRFNLSHLSDKRFKCDTFKKLHSYLTAKQMLRYKETEGCIFTPTVIINLIRKYYTFNHIG